MAASAVRSRKRAKRVEPEELTARILSYSRNYFIALPGVGKDSVGDDEAALEVEGIIERVSQRRHVKHVGQPISFRLLHARRYQGHDEDGCSYFGSVTFWGSQRSVLAYLPREPFWALAGLIDAGSKIIQCTYLPMRGGHAELISFYLAVEECRVDS
jgi:hypothetical protein